MRGSLTLIKRADRISSKEAELGSELRLIRAPRARSDLREPMPASLNPFGHARNEEIGRRERLDPKDGGKHSSHHGRGNDECDAGDIALEASPMEREPAREAAPLRLRGDVRMRGVNEQNARGGTPDQLLQLCHESLEIAVVKAAKSDPHIGIRRGIEGDANRARRCRGVLHTRSLVENLTEPRKY